MKRWENIKKWTGLEWNMIQRKAETREELRKLVVKSIQCCPDGQPYYGIDKIRDAHCSSLSISVPCRFPRVKTAQYVS